MTVGAVVIGVVTALVPTVAVVPVAAATSPWRPPVPGPLVRPFEAPAGDYGAGHRGVDYAAPTGSVVTAAGPGTVSFAGPVAGSLHVVVDHGGGLRTSTSFLATVQVGVGDPVVAGTVVGTAGGVEAASGHDGGVVHFGVRVGERYVDPARLFAERDLTRRVRLVPTGRVPADPGPWTTPAAEVAGPPSPGGDCRIDVPVLGGVLGDMASVACAVVDWAARETWRSVQVGLWVAVGWDVGGRDAVRRLTPVLREIVEFAASVSAERRERFLAGPPGAVLRDLYAIGARALAWYRQECDDDPLPAVGSAGSERRPGGDGPAGGPNRLMAVAGIHSRTGPDGRTFGLDLAAIGVDASDVTWFSYAADGDAYTEDQTELDLRAAARLLAVQLQALHAADPDRPVDIVAHSQGGVVVDWFLTHQYDRHPDRYPPLETVVTLATPHQGAPLATTAAALRAGRTTRGVLEVFDRLGVAPDTGSPAVRQLASGSDFMRELHETPLPSHLDYVSIGGTDDVVVPADRIHVDGAREVVLAIDGPDDHSAIVDDARAMEVVRRALAGLPLPCMTFEEGVRSAVEPVVISRVQTELGPLLATYVDTRGWMPPR